MGTVSAACWIWQGFTATRPADLGQDKTQHLVEAAPAGLPSKQQELTNPPNHVRLVFGRRIPMAARPHRAIDGWCPGWCNVLPCRGLTAIGDSRGGEPRGTNPGAGILV